MVHRRDSARVVLIAPSGRTLLFEVADPVSQSGRSIWITAGGGVKPGETPAQAACRELREETGIECDQAMLGAPVAVTRGPWSLGGRAIYSEDWFFTLRCDELDPVDTAWTALERRVHRGWRWWSADELEDTSEVVLPGGLAGLVRSILSGDLEVDPVELPWRTTDGT